MLQQIARQVFLILIGEVITLSIATIAKSKRAKMALFAVGTIVTFYLGFPTIQLSSINVDPVTQSILEGILKIIQTIILVALPSIVYVLIAKRQSIVQYLTDLATSVFSRSPVSKTTSSTAAMIMEVSDDRYKLTSIYSLVQSQEKLPVGDFVALARSFKDDYYRTLAIKLLIRITEGYISKDAKKRILSRMSDDVYKNRVLRIFSQRGE